MNLFYRFFWYILWVIPRVYFRMRIDGKEHFPQEGAVLLAANHCSYLDPPILALGLNRQVHFLAKQELFSKPVIGWWIRKIGTQSVRRKEGDTKAIYSIMRLLKNNRVVCLFPEGTRSYDGEFLPFENGIAWVAVKTQIPIVPIYIRGTYEAFPRGSIFPKPCKVNLLIGPAIHPESLQSDKSHQEEKVKQLTNQLRETLENLKIEQKRIEQER